MNLRLSHIFLILLLLSGCGEQPAETVPEKGAAPVSGLAEIKLEPVDFADLPGWKNDSLEGAYHAFALNCTALNKSDAPRLGNAAVEIDAGLMRRACADFAAGPRQDFKAFITEHFTPYRVTAEDKSEGKFTSYFESSLHASYQRSERYKFPIYGRPLDLIEFNPADFDPAMPSARLVGRLEGTKLVPYYTRSEIMDSAFSEKAPVILWADSYVDIYVMQIQGSAVAELDDGSKVRVGFADTNGRPFKGIGSILLEKKLLKPGNASMGQIKKWLKENYAEAYEHMNQNQRFVFHRLIEDDGPVGALGVPLTPGRSLAVDKRYIPLGALLWLDTRDGSRQPIQKLVFAQDIGGAIKGPIRGDYFWGSGGDEVLEHAGKMNAPGSYYILLPRGQEIKR